MKRKVLGRFECHDITDAHEFAATFVVELLEDLVVQFLGGRPLYIRNHIFEEST